MTIDSTGRLVHICIEGFHVPLPEPDAIIGLPMKHAQGLCSSDESALVRWMKDRALPVYTAVFYGKEFSLTHFCFGWERRSIDECALDAGVTVRTVQNWIREFIAWLPVCAERENRHERQLDLIDVHDSEIHRGLKDGRTKDHRMRECKASNCLVCAMKRA